GSPRRSSLKLRQTRSRTTNRSSPSFPTWPSPGRKTITPVNHRPPIHRQLLPNRPPAGLAVAAGMGWLLVVGSSVAQSDYERGLRALEPASAAPDELRRADLLFRRASFTECLEDLRAAKSAFDLLSESADIPGFALARARLALHFHSLTE